MSRFSDAVNTQIANEFAASQQYMAIAVYYDAGDASAAGGALLPAGGRGAEPRDDARPVPARRRASGRRSRASSRPQTAFADEPQPVALALEQERTVTAQISSLVELAREENDHVGEQFLHWFLEEQREEVASMSALLAVVERAGADQLLLVEDYLSRTAVIAAEPSSTAPPAAGGAL